MFHGALVRVLEGQVFGNHEIQHEEQVPFRVAFAVTQKRRPLGRRQMFVPYSFANQLSRALLIHQLSRETRPQLFSRRRVI